MPPARIIRKEAFSFALARKLLAAFEGTPLELEMRSVLAKIAESLEGEVLAPKSPRDKITLKPQEGLRQNDVMPNGL